MHIMVHETPNMLILLLVCVSLHTVHGQLVWKRLHDGSGTAPPKRRDTAIAHDSSRNKLVVFGGRPGAMSDTWIYDIAANTWREVSTTVKPHGRFSFVSGLSGDYFYISTGEDENRKFYNDIWRLDLRTEIWEELPAQAKPSYVSESAWRNQSSDALIPSTRYGSAGGIYPGSNRFFISLGFAEERYFDTMSYDVERQAWYSEYCRHCHPYNPSYPHARCLHSGTMISEDELVIYGGCLTGGGTGGPCPAGDSWIFNARSRKWKELEGCPPASTYSAMALLPFPVSVGSPRVLLYGGVEESPQVIKTMKLEANHVALLDPVNRLWTLRETSGFENDTVPSKRYSAAMTTGRDGVYMFGGQDSFGPSNEIWILMGDSSDAENAQQVPCAPGLINRIMIHGILMVIAWGFFLPWGTFFARYLKSTDPLWFYVHVTFQIFGLCCAIAGLVLGILSVQFGHFQFIHAIIGLVTMALGIMQPLNALVRPHPPDVIGEKTRMRRVWEFIHHFGGRVGILLGLVNISLGVFLALSHVLIWGLWFGYLALFIIICLMAEKYKRHRAERTRSPDRYLLGPSKNSGLDYPDAFVNPITEDDKL